MAGILSSLGELGHAAFRSGADAVPGFKPDIDLLRPAERIIARADEALTAYGKPIDPVLKADIAGRFDVLNQYVAKAGNDPDRYISELTDVANLQIHNYLPNVPTNTKKLLADKAILDVVMHSDALTDNNLRQSVMNTVSQVKSDKFFDAPTNFISDRLEVDPVTKEVVQNRLDEANSSNIGNIKYTPYGDIEDVNVVDRTGQRKIKSGARAVIGSAVTIGTRLNLLGGETLNRMFGRGEQLGQKLLGESIHLLRSGFDDGQVPATTKQQMIQSLDPAGQQALASVRAAENAVGPDALRQYRTALSQARRTIPESMHAVLTPGTADEVYGVMKQLPNYKAWERNARKHRYAAEIDERFKMPAKAQLLVENMANANNHVRQAGRSTGDRGLEYWGDYFGGGKQKSNVQAQKAFIDAHESGFKSADGKMQLYRDTVSGETLLKDESDAFFKQDASGSLAPADGTNARLWFPERTAELEDSLNAIGVSLDPYAIRKGKYASANTLSKEKFDEIESEVKKGYIGDDKISASGSTSAKRIHADMPDHYEELFVSPFEATQMNMKDQANKAGMKYALLDALGVKALSPTKQGEMRDIIDQAATMLNPSNSRQVAQSLVSRIAKTQEMSAGSISALTNVTEAMLNHSLGVNVQKANTFTRAVDAIVATLLSQPASWAKQATDFPAIAAHADMKNMLSAVRDVVKHSPPAVDVTNKMLTQFNENLQKVSRSNLGKTDKALEIYAHIVGTPFKKINEFTANVAANATFKKMMDVASKPDSIEYKQLREDLIHRGGEEYADKVLIDIAAAKGTIDVHNEIARVMGHITPHSMLNSPSLKITNSGPLVDQLLVLKNFMINRMSSVVENVILPLANSKSISQESFNYAMKRTAILLAYMGGLSFTLSNLIDRARHKKGSDEKSPIQIAANTLSIAVGLPEDTLEGLALKPGMTAGRFAMPAAAAPLGVIGDAVSGVRRLTDSSYKPRSIVGTNTLSLVPFAGGITRDIANRQVRKGIDNKKSYEKVKARMRQMGIEY